MTESGNHRHHTSAVIIGTEPPDDTLVVTRIERIPCIAAGCADSVQMGIRDQALKGKYSDSEYYKCLNGEWNFSYAEDFRDLPKDFWNPDYDDSAWGSIAVPSNWEFNGYGTPIYVNSPFEMDPNTGAKKEPAFPEKIPGGAYRVWFTVPSDWDGRSSVRAALRAVEPHMFRPAATKAFAMLKPIP